jgi:hypothetical protein
MVLGVGTRICKPRPANLTRTRKRAVSGLVIRIEITIRFVLDMLREIFNNTLVYIKNIGIESVILSFPIVNSEKMQDCSLKTRSCDHF